MNQRFILRTLDGTQYHLIQHGLSGSCIVVFDSGPGGRKEFPQMLRALFCLGGIVDWRAWDAPSSQVLLALNGGQAI